MFFRVTTLVKCELTYRDTIGSMIRHVCNRLESQGEDSSFGHQVISAFNEAFNNLVNHGGKQVSTREVLVTIAVTDLQLIIEMDDDADGFHPPTQLPKMNDLRESGMGLLIIRECMDKLDYKRQTKNGVNSLRMVRNLTIRPEYV